MKIFQRFRRMLSAPARWRKLQKCRHWKHVRALLRAHDHAKRMSDSRSLSAATRWHYSAERFFLENRIYNATGLRVALVRVMVFHKVWRS